MLKIYHNPFCSKSKCLLEYLEKNKIPYEFVDFMNTPLTREKLIEILKKLNLSAEELTRKSELLFQEKFSTENLSEEDYLRILSENPSLIQRPIAEDEHKAMIIRPLEKIEEFLK